MKANWLKIIRLTMLTGILAIALMSIAAHAAGSGVVVLQVKGTINPVLVDYIERGIEEAEDRNAEACIIQLDTPGG